MAKRVVLAPDKFRGTATAREICESAAAVLTAAGWEAIQLPCADGGEGTVDAFGGANRVTTVSGPVGDPIEAGWRLDRGLAVIEMAAASGLLLAGGAEHNDALGASTYGTGELIAEAVDRGAKRVIIGVGGSATTDGGLGALRAMYPVQRYRGIELVVATDVRTKFRDAASIFGPQKGATPAQVKLLTARLDRLQQVYVEDYGSDISDVAGGGAAGGLAGGLAAIGATLVPGFECVADEIGLAEAIEAADLVITGEGQLDDTSFDGKVVGGVCGLAAEMGVPVLVVAGTVATESPLPAGVVVKSLTERFGLDASRADAPGLFAQIISEQLASGDLAGLPI